ncbi:uncharacterized protein LOC123312193 [Coccinella septempunctata]|uniref:uncharacterized protein LOC123312193 n=1 Tax=Coccinella septempunctata TaxID=41139 RepID=UPI001D0653F9|nr:uncharacterized protein LOC123312193 [Coccinella septempunctata]
MNLKMKLIGCFFLIVGVTSSAISSSVESETGLETIWGDKLVKEGETLKATVNNYADELLHNLDKLAVKAGIDPMKVDDLEVKISRRILLITYTGKLKLTKIKVNDFSTIHRYDDAIVTYNKENKKFRIDIPLELKDIKFECHFKATLMGLGPSGALDGEMKSVRMIASIEIDFSTFEASVAQYKITHSDHITVHLHEFILIDWMINIIANTVTTVFKGLILGIVDTVVDGVLKASVNMINLVFEDVTEFIEGNSTELVMPLVLKNIGISLSERNFNIS